MTRRILIHYPVLNLGGAEMSTLRLARALADRGWRVDMTVTTGGGALEAKLDRRVKLRALRSRPAGDRASSARTLGARLRAIPDLLAYGWQRLHELLASIPYLFRRYDAAIIGLQGLSPAFCTTWVRARRRLHFVRSDVSRLAAQSKVEKAVLPYRDRIDWYVCVSEYARDAFVSVFPDLKTKTTAIYNILDVPAMQALAASATDPYEDCTGLKVVTVCRLQEASKGLVRMARVARRLLDQGLDFHWFVVGDGPDRRMLEKAIDDLDIGERFILAGHAANPFGYYRYADVVAVLSNYEGLCGAVNEAKAVGKAVLATRFSGVGEQIEHEVNGLIVDNDEDAIVEGMARMLTDPALRERLAARPLPAAIADDEAKLLRLEALIVGHGHE
ncbi:MAG TPA: glycosyltransferase [Caulobacteraceae bacterium]